MYTKSKFLAFLALISLVYHFAFPQYAWADFYGGTIESVGSNGEYQLILTGSDGSDDLATLYGQAMLPSASPETSKTASTRWVIVTAYSSTHDQTDASPFITASGTYVRDGIVAANFLKFGAKVRFPELYGNKVFIVEDRMAKKNSHKIDIWFPTRWEAINFGVKKTRIEILET